MNTILVPHPVLRPGGTDYKSGLKFDMELVGDPRHTLDDKIRVPVKFDLESRFVRGLIRGKKARITVVVKCTRTYERTVFDMDGMKSVLELPLGRHADKIILSSYVSATEPIACFKSKEHHDEFSGVEINLPVGAILARGSDIELTIDALQTLSAAIHFATNNRLEDGQYDIDVEGNHIKISMNEKTRRSVEALRKAKRHLLYPSIYMTALTHAIQNVTPDRTRKWEEALRNTLKKNGISIDDEEDLKSKAYVYAQKLLKHPVRFITELADQQQGADTDE